MEKAETRLSREDWLDQALKTLARHGPKGLKADALAKELGVSRGSFYWHFPNTDAFRAAVLAHWRSRTTEAVISYVEDAAADDSRLNVLMKRALTGEDRLEQAIRAWAAQDRAAAEMIAEVDRVRTDYLTKLLRAAGLASDTARLRARFLYWANLGRLAVGDPDLRSMDMSEADEIARLLRS